MGIVVIFWYNVIIFKDLVVSFNLRNVCIYESCVGGKLIIKGGGGKIFLLFFFLVLIFMYNYVLFCRC